VIILWVNKILSQNEAPVTFSPQFLLCLAECAVFGLFMQHSQGVAEGPLAFLGDMTHSAKITALFGDQIEAGKGPDLAGFGEATGMAQVGQVY
jgi:hypothetical protein